MLRCQWKSAGDISSEVGKQDAARHRTANRAKHNRCYEGNNSMAQIDCSTAILGHERDRLCGAVWTQV